MQIGTGLYTGQQRPDDTRTWTEINEEMIDLVKMTEEVGLDSAWVSEHHFAEDGYMPSLLPTLAAFARETEDIELVTSMVLAPLHDSIRLAEDAATVSLLSEGRLTLGLTNGYRPYEFEQFGVDQRDRPLMTEEAVRVARAAWSEGPLGFSPRFHDATSDANVTPKPAHAPNIMLGGVSKPAVRRAAQIADGWCAPEMISLDEVAKRQRYQNRLREAEKIDDDFTTYAHQWCFVGESREDAWETIRESLFYLQRTYEGWGYGEAVEELNEETKQELKDHAIVGAPARIVERLEEYQDTLGDDTHMQLRLYFPGVDTDDMRHAIELIGDEVAPELQ
jgi:alkanesulfonate monooxygenase SsuD/methylene tetrahydromethanopterin reductase-like flavin-dependent oxidoreductase (luciferase family)